MSNSIMDITHNHGREMYILGMEHAVKTMEMLGEGAVAYLNEQIAKERKELEDERAQQIQRRASSDV